MQARIAWLGLGLLLALPTRAATVLEDAAGLHITGEIEPGDDIKVAQLLARNPTFLLVDLESPGGDIDTAMSIGAVLRKHDAIVYSTGCYSSCALIIAGGVIRARTPLSNRDPVVGVHRIFFAELKPGLSQDEVKARYDAQLKRVRKYLAEMNVAPELVSFMQSFEPGEMHILTHEELTRYGLGARDPVYDERLTADRAAEIGITSLEYRERKSRGREACGDVNAAEDEQERDKRAQCQVAIEYGISISTYRQRGAEYKERCRAFTDEKEKWRCYVHFMVSGQAVP